MRGLRVSDLMTWPVIAARVTTPFKELVSLLEKNEISAVPVIDEHRRPIGVVTEADLLARHGEMTRESRIPFAGIRRRHARQAAHGLTARDLMTRHVRTVGRDDPAAGAARYLADARLHRLYVVDGSGRLQTVSVRSNPRYYRLIQAFGRLSGVPMLLNTSFNENEPIVLTPAQALDCFLRTSMDVLVMGRHVLERARLET